MPTLDDVCLFAHFDRDDVVDDHVIQYLRAIRSCGFFVVVISTSRLQDVAVAKLKAVAQEVILRDNRGHDFGSWGVGLQRFGDQIDGTLLLANDSVYAPIGNLKDAIRTLTRVQADAYGMTMSSEIELHLQSWFLLLTRDVHSHPAFRAIFEQNFADFNKQDIVRRGEVLLSQTLLKAGFRLHALFEGLPNVASQFNCCHVLWRQLVEQQGVPFIKVELLRFNPMNVPNVNQWRAVVAKRTPHLVPLIDSHLQRLAAGSNEFSPPELPAFRKTFYSFIGASYEEYRHGRSLGRSIKVSWARARLRALSFAYRAWRWLCRRLGINWTGVAGREGG